MPIYSISNGSIPSRPRRTMSDIYNWYRSGVLHYGPYRPYFNSGTQDVSKNKKYSPERHIEQRSEGERNEHSSEAQPIKAEVKSEIVESQDVAKAEASQKTTTTENTETRQTEYQNDTTLSENSEYQKLGLPESYEKVFGQTETMRRNRVSDQYDRSETMW